MTRLPHKMRAAAFAVAWGVAAALSFKGIESKPLRELDLVQSNSAVGYSGIDGPQGQPTQLFAGQTLQDFTPAFSTQWYSLFVQPTFASFTVSVTPNFGNPNLFARVGTLNPATPQYSSSSSMGIDFITIGRNDTIVATGCTSWPANPCTFFFWVTAGTRLANYTISVNDGSASTQLIANVPAIGSLNANSTVQTAAYSFAVPLGATFATFILAPLGNNGPRSVPLLAVSITNANNVTTYCAQSNDAATRSGIEVIVLTPASTTCWCTNCTYFITVTVRNTPGALQVQPFALTASLQANPVRQLFDGISLSGDASNGLGPGAIPIFVFNAFFDNFTARNLRIIESPLVGAMQLYVTLDGSSPSPSNFAYSSLRFSGQNEIVVRVRDPAVQQYCAPANAANMSCPVQIAIYATTVRASFAIVATLAAVQELVPGQPINDYAWANRVTSYFMPDINFNGTAIFTVTPLSSQFVNIYVGSDQVPGTRVGIPGNASSYCYTNVGNVGSPAAITIPPTDPCFCQALPCNYYVSIGGFPNNTVDYTVLGRYAGGFSVLQLNVPVTDVLPPSAQTTSINNYWINYPEAIGGSRPADSLTFNVDSVPNAGRLSLFASVCAIGINCPPSGPFIGPNPGQFQWQFRMSTGMQNAQVVISATDPLFIANCQQYIVPGLPYNSSCVAQVAVRADPTVPVPAVYTITAFAAARQLVDGQVVQAISQTNQLTYFRYTVVDLRRPLKITVAALAGDPDLFVGIGMIPNATSFSFTSTTPGVEVISITWDSPAVVRMIPPGGVPFDVLIGVLGNDGPAVYNIDATSNGIVQLRDGATVGGSAGPLGFAYYFFTIPANQTQRTGFRVSVTAVAGPQPFILVNTPNRPGPNGFPLLPRCAQTTCDGTGFTNFAITSANSLSPTFVEVDPDSQFYSAGIFAIGIFATEFTTFQITASSLNSIITVGDGIPYNGFLILSNYTFFVLPIFSVFSAMSITLDTTGGLPVGVDIFASTNSTIRRPRLANCGNQNQNAPCPLGVPGIFASTTMFTRPTAELLISASNISAPSGAACNILPCSLYFSITETNNRYIGNISYTITARTIGNSSRTLLPVGQPLFGRLPSLGIAYYYGEMVNVNRSSFSVTITLSPVALTTALYVTLDGSQPGPGNSVYNSTTSSGVNYVSIPRSVIVAAAVNGNVVINMAVNTPSHPSQTAQYWIAWTNTDPNVVNQLVAGVPAVGVLFGRTFAYYYFTAPALNAFSDVTLSLTNNAGDSSLFLSRWSDVGNNTAFRPGPVPISTNCANSTNDGADWIIIPSAGASPFPSPAGVPYAQACRCTSYPCNYIVAVYCAVSARCQFSLTVTLGDTTPLLLPEGQALTLPLIPARNIYYYYDMRDAIANGRNMTIIAPAVGGSLPNVFLYATSTFLPGITDPSLLPVAASAGTYIWSSNAAGVPPSSSPTITISPTDPAFATCNATSGCPFITFGVSSDMATGTSTARPQWFSAGGVPQQVALGSTSAVQGLAAGSSRTFVMTLSTTQRNLIVFATLTFGNVGFTISNSNPQTTCTVPPPPGPPGAYTCDGTWATVANPGFSGPSQIIVAASNPCANSNPNARPACSNQTAWATGPYWITVYAISDARFTLSTGLVGVPQVLTDGIPAQTTTDNINQPLFDFRTASRASTTNFPVALYITATTNALNVYVNSCRDGVCTPQNQLPVPGSAMATVTVPAGATQVVTFSVGQNAYCAQLQGSFCHYYVAITPQTSCDPRAGCSAATTIMGTVQTGTAPVPVAFNQIQNTVAATNGVLPATGNQLYEVYLDPALGASTVFLVLDSCGPGYPAMYGCNPDTRACGQGNYAPSPARGFSNFATPALYGGRDVIVMPTVTSNAVFMQMLVDPGTAPTTRPAFQYLLGAGQPTTGRGAFLLGPGASGTTSGAINLVQVFNKSDIAVSWPAAVLYSSSSCSPPNCNPIGPAVGATYTLYVAVGGFNASFVNPITNSPCGLDSWLATAPPGSGIYNISTATNFTVLGLAATSYYEVNVVAACNAACFAASLPPADAQSMAKNMHSFSVVNGRRLQTSAISQRAPYTMVNFNSAANNLPGPSNAAAVNNLPIVIGGAVGGAVVALCCASLLCVCLRRRRARIPKEASTPDDRAKRVAQLGLGGSSSALPTTSPAAKAAAVEISASRAERAAFEPVGPGAAAGNWK